MPYTVYRTQNFRAKLLQNAKWLYDHNLEDYGEGYADDKLMELQDEVDSLERQLAESPYVYRAEDTDHPTTRVHSVYDDRFQCVWEIQETNQNVFLTDFRDLKYPEERRYESVEFEEED